MSASLRIELFPADLDASVAFYESVGFTVTSRRDGPPRYASIELGEVRVGLCEAERVDPSCRAIPAGTEIVIEVDDVRATRNAATAAGLTLTEDLEQRPWGLSDFRVTDPDGYYLRFTGRRVDPPRP